MWRPWPIKSITAQRPRHRPISRRFFFALPNRPMLGAPHSGAAVDTVNAPRMACGRPSLPRSAIVMLTRVCPATSHGHCVEVRKFLWKNLWLSSFSTVRVGTEALPSRSRAKFISAGKSNPLMHFPVEVELRCPALHSNPVSCILT